MYFNITIIILCVLCIVVISNHLYKLNNSSEKIKENFNNGVTTVCNFQPSDSMTHPECLSQCIQYANSDENSDELDACLNEDNIEGCIKKCEIYHTQNSPCIRDDGSTDCLITPHYDISGASIQQCVDRCKANTCYKGCTKYTINDPNTGQQITDEYTHRISDYDKCDASIQNHKYCSKCVEQCKNCSDPRRCKWLTPEEDEEQSRQAFRNAPFNIGVIPENESAVIYWNETSQDVKNYLIMYYRKDEVNLNSENVQQTPIQIRTINRSFEKTGPNTHTIHGLENGVLYTVTINKISNHNQARGAEVKSSNTVDIVPSTVSVINFSGLESSSHSAQHESVPSSIMNNLLGKTIDLTL